MLLIRALKRALSVVDILDRLDVGRIWPLSMLSVDTKRLLVRKIFNLFSPLVTPIRVQGLLFDMPNIIEYGLKNSESGFLKIMNSYLKPGMVVVDVGANIGYLTIIAARLVGPEGKVYTVEPDKSNLKFIKKNIQNNGFDNIEVLPCAAGATSGTREFHLYGEGNLDSFYARPDLPALETVTVDTVRLDDVVKCKVDFVKIDVEGAEIEVLLGMDDILASNPDIRLIVEFNPSCLQSAGYPPEELPRFLMERGFALSTIDKAGCTPLDMDRAILIAERKLSKRFGHVDIFAERVER